MARTSAAQVRGIIKISLQIDVAPFIDVANELVTECCTASDYSEHRLQLIECWLAAHLCAIRDMRAASEMVGSVSAWYQYKLGLNLACTMYGQQVMMLDTAGNLAAISKAAEKGGAASADATWLGSNCE